MYVEAWYLNNGKVQKIDSSTTPIVNGSVIPIAR
jgi:hypothetical protein